MLQFCIPFPCSVKKDVIKIWETAHEKTCVRVFFNNVLGLKACNFIYKDSNLGVLL